MKYKKICLILSIISILCIILALLLFKDISFCFIGISIVIIGVILKLIINSSDIK